MAEQLLRGLVDRIEGTQTRRHDDRYGHALAGGGRLSDASALATVSGSDAALAGVVVLIVMSLVTLYLVFPRRRRHRTDSGSEVQDKTD